MLDFVPVRFWYFNLSFVGISVLVFRDDIACVVINGFGLSCWWYFLCGKRFGFIVPMTWFVGKAWMTQYGLINDGMKMRGNGQVWWEFQWFWILRFFCATPQPWSTCWIKSFLSAPLLIDLTIRCTGAGHGLFWTTNHMGRPVTSMLENSSHSNFIDEKRFSCRAFIVRNNRSEWRLW